MMVTTIAGPPRSGKTEALIAIAQRADRRGTHPIVFVSPWSDVRHLLRAADLPPATKVVPLQRALQGLRGLHPELVLVDDLDAVADAQRDELLTAIRFSGARFLVTASR